MGERSSQSILGGYSEDELPEQAHASIEADVAFGEDPDNDKSDAVDTHLGQVSRFHATIGYYARGVEVGTAVLPRGRREHVVPYQAPAVGHCEASLVRTRVPGWITAWASRHG